VSAEQSGTDGAWCSEACRTWESDCAGSDRRNRLMDQPGSISTILRDLFRAAGTQNLGQSRTPVRISLNRPNLAREEPARMLPGTFPQTTSTSAGMFARFDLMDLLNTDSTDSGSLPEVRGDFRPRLSVSSDDAFRWHGLSLLFVQRILLESCSEAAATSYHAHLTRQRRNRLTSDSFWTRDASKRDDFFGNECTRGS